MKKVILVLGCMVWLGMGSQGNADLAFTPVTPCRIIDTRGSGPIVMGTTRDFLVTGTTGFDSQGGNLGGCGIPDDATSVMINFIAVGPTAPGDLRAWPFGGVMPNASIINFASVPGLNIANGLIQPICNPAVATCTSDLTVFAEGSDVHLVADVTGYFGVRTPVTVTVNCPGQSLQASVDAAGAGDVINVTGTCIENVVIREEKQRLTLDGQNAAILNGPSSLPTLNVKGKGILIQNFYNSGAITGGTVGIYVNRNASATINHNNIHNTGASGISINQLSFAVIKNNNIHDNPGSGIYVYENSDARIGFDSTADSTSSPNTIQNNGDRGITVTQTSHATIVGNTIASNGSDGIGVFRLSSADIASNTINGNGASGVNVSNNSSVNLGEDTPADFFDQPNITTVYNGAFGINCSLGGSVKAHLGSQYQINGTSGQTSISTSCPNSIVTP